MKIKIKKFKKVKSTNDIALKLIKKNIPEPILILSKNKPTVEVELEENGFLKMEIFLFLYFLDLIKKKLILNNLQF